MKKRVLLCLVAILCYGVVAALPGTAFAGWGNGCRVQSVMVKGPPECIFDIYARAVATPPSLAYHVQSWSILPSTALVVGTEGWVQEIDDGIAVTIWGCLIAVDEGQKATSSVTFQNSRGTCTVIVESRCE